MQNNVCLITINVQIYTLYAYIQNKLSHFLILLNRDGLYRAKVGLFSGQTVDVKFFPC